MRVGAGEISERADNVIGASMISGWAMGSENWEGGEPDYISSKGGEKNAF